MRAEAPILSPLQMNRFSKLYLSRSSYCNTCFVIHFYNCIVQKSNTTIVCCLWGLEVLQRFITGYSSVCVCVCVGGGGGGGGGRDGDQME